MKQIKTFTRADARVLEVVRPLLARCRERDLCGLPPVPPPPLNREQLGSALFQRGVAFDAVDRVCTAIEKLRHLVGWYQHSRFGPGRPTEHEVVAHIILPIMLALGWSEQLLAIEWKRRDLAAFQATPTNNENCRLVVEAKQMSDGLQGVFDQAVTYTSDLPNCDRILVTNGIRNYMHVRTGGEWCKKPRHYFNLSRLREDHVCLPGTNAVDGIVALTPAHVAR